MVSWPGSPLLPVRRNHKALGVWSCISRGLSVWCGPLKSWSTPAVSPSWLRQCSCRVVDFRSELGGSRSNWARSQGRCALGQEVRTEAAGRVLASAHRNERGATESRPLFIVDLGVLFHAAPEEGRYVQLALGVGIDKDRAQSRMHVGHLVHGLARCLANRSIDGTVAR